MQARIADALVDVLSAVANGQLGEEQLPDVERSLLGSLAGWGEPDRHGAAVTIVTRQLFDHAQRELALRREASTGAAPLVANTRSALAAELARQLVLMAEGRSAGADALEVDPPEGCERVAWNQLGGFAYREGERLPAAAQGADRCHDPWPDATQLP
jgi:hypothetical protein